MGQKVNPIGFRMAVHKQWKSRWFAERKEFGDLLNEDLMIRDMVRAKLKDAAVADIVRLLRTAMAHFAASLRGLQVRRSGTALGCPGCIPTLVVIPNEVRDLVGCGKGRSLAALGMTVRFESE